MLAARPGDTVAIHYTGRFEDGTVFAESGEDDPLEFTLGQGHVLPGLEQAVVGMSAGQSKSVTIPMHQAYGPHRKDLVILVERQRLPDGLEPKTGQRLNVRGPGGRARLATITAVSDSSVVLDANHPLAGRNLTFDIVFLGVVRRGGPQGPARRPSATAPASGAEVERGPLRTPGDAEESGANGHPLNRRPEDRHIQASGGGPPGNASGGERGACGEAHGLSAQWAASVPGARGGRNEHCVGC